jgi:predicted transcriptional regulator
MNRLGTAMAEVRWTSADIARELAVSERTVRRWLDGSYDCPEHILMWADRLAAAHRDNPPPPKP